MEFWIHRQIWLMTKIVPKCVCVRVDWHGDKLWVVWQYIISESDKRKTKRWATWRNSYSNRWREFFFCTGLSDINVSQGTCFLFEYFRINPIQSQVTLSYQHPLLRWLIVYNLSQWSYVWSGDVVSYWWVYLNPSVKFRKITYFLKKFLFLFSNFCLFVNSKWDCQSRDMLLSKRDHTAPLCKKNINSTNRWNK